MIRLVNTTSNYKDFITNYGPMLRATQVAGLFELPDSIGKGYIFYLEMTTRHELLIMDCICRSPVNWESLKNEEETYFIKFEQVFPSKPMNIELNRKNLQHVAEKRSVIYLTSSLFNVKYLVPRDTRVQSVNMVLPAAWLGSFLGLNKKGSMMSQYIRWQAANLIYQPMSREERAIFDEIMDTDRNSAMYNLKISNRVMLMLEGYFKRLATKDAGLKHSPKIDESILRRIIEVERKLTGNLSKKPPTIAELSRLALMSETSLKNLFKKVYGDAPYEYFLKSRMYKAKEMLMSGEFSVKEVGVNLGYKNLSHFSQAFKNVFGILPGDYIN